MKWYGECSWSELTGYILELNGCAQRQENGSRNSKEPITKHICKDNSYDFYLDLPSNPHIKDIWNNNTGLAKYNSDAVISRLYFRHIWEEDEWV